MKKILICIMFLQQLHAQLVPGFCIRAYHPAAWGTEQFWTERLRSRVKTAQRSIELRSRRENLIQPLPIFSLSLFLTFHFFVSQLH